VSRPYSIRSWPLASSRNRRKRLLKDAYLAPCIGPHARGRQQGNQINSRVPRAGRHPLAMDHLSARQATISVGARAGRTHPARVHARARSCAARSRVCQPATDCVAPHTDPAVPCSSSAQARARALPGLDLEKSESVWLSLCRSPLRSTPSERCPPRRPMS
jgi:hypothetical protein